MTALKSKACFLRVYHTGSQQVLLSLPDICDFQFQSKYSGVMQFCRTRVICPRFKDQGGFGRLIAEIKKTLSKTQMTHEAK